MAEEMAKYHLEHIEQATPTKKNFLNTPQSKEDTDRLLRRIMTQEDLVREMIEDDLGRQVFKPSS